MFNKDYKKEITKLNDRIDSLEKIVQHSISVNTSYVDAVVHEIKFPNGEITQCRKYGFNVIYQMIDYKYVKNQNINTIHLADIASKIDEYKIYIKEDTIYIAFKYVYNDIEKFKYFIIDIKKNIAIDYNDISKEFSELNWIKYIN